MSETTPEQLAKQYSYNQSLINQWLNFFDLKIIQTYLNKLRQPAKSLWLQANTNKIDVDSLIEFLEEMEFKVQASPFFDDVIEIPIEKKDLELDYEAHPAVIVDREAAAGVFLGKDVKTSEVIGVDKFRVNDTVKIIDRTGQILAIGKAMVNSNEISSLTQQVVAKVSKSKAKIPAVTELRYYRRGLFTVLTPTQIFGIKSMYIEKEDNVLVISPDRGDVATTIAHLSNYSVPITVIAQNQNQARAIRKQIERMKAKSVKLIVIPVTEFIKQHHDITYTSVYVELPNSRTAIMPTLNSNLTAKRVKQLAKRQKEILTYIFRCLHPNASITYVNHSLDPLENELLYRDIVTKSYYESQSFPNIIRKNDLSAFSTQRDLKSDIISDIKFHLKIATMFIDPLKIENTGGFIAKLKYSPEVTAQPDKIR